MDPSSLAVSLPASKDMDPSSLAVVSLPANKEHLRKESKRKGTLFSHRKTALFRKADRIFQDCDAKVYTFIERKGRIWIYTSHPDDETLPRSQESMCEQYPLPIIFTPGRPVGVEARDVRQGGGWGDEGQERVAP
ncbi:hypothetical protein CPLU01_16067 [Colletotrichum plurivorum]|uniref:MADS-box domain-containing protein n=1 Tax=Colletotrichum plurivorum TaxID=2175906 RepID=A0A8H6J0Q3_9PEZI|nr:hypothetical protein CPLU01_16067 [Colletotrichum plurivorum]